MMGKRAIRQLSYVAAAHYELPLCSAPDDVLAHILLTTLLYQVIRAGLNNLFSATTDQVLTLAMSSTLTYSL